jgi:hypothetical protein
MESHRNTYPLANHNRLLATTQHWIGRNEGSRQIRGKSGSAACSAESLWLSGADSLPSSPRLGWKAEPSSRAEGVSQGEGPRKGKAFPQSRRQSRFGMLPFGDFDATLGRNANTTVFCAEITAGAEMSADPISARNPPSRLTSIKSFADM